MGRDDLPEIFAEFTHGISSVFQVVTFFLLGALLVSSELGDGFGVLLVFASLTLFVARPVAVLIAFSGVALPLSEKLFVAWFGPKGVASILFALIVLNSPVPGGVTIFQAAAFTVVASIVVHGITETIGARVISRRRGRAPRTGDAITLGRRGNTSDDADTR